MWSTPISKSTGDLVSAADWVTNTVDNPTALLPMAVEFFIDGGGAVVGACKRVSFEAPFSFDINRYTMVASPVGSIQVMIMKTAYSALPPTGASDISGGSPWCVVASAEKAQDSTLSGWTTQVNAGDIIMANVEAASEIEWCMLSLKGTRD